MAGLAAAAYDPEPTARRADLRTRWEIVRGVVGWPPPPRHRREHKKHRSNTSTPRFRRHQHISQTEAGNGDWHPVLMREMCRNMLGVGWSGHSHGTVICISSDEDEKSMLASVDWDEVAG